MHQRLDFILRRFAFSLLILIAVLVLNFLLFRIIPGDPVQMLMTPRMTEATRERIRQEYGLDKPLWLNFQAYRDSGEFSALFDAQFVYYAKNLARGELGESFRQRKPVAELLKNRIGPSILLICTAEILSIIIGTFFG